MSEEALRIPKSKPSTREIDGEAVALMREYAEQRIRLKEADAEVISRLEEILTILREVEPKRKANEELKRIVLDKLNKILP